MASDIKIDSICKINTELIEMSNGECFYRDSSGFWSKKIGESVEHLNSATVVNKLESIYQEHKRSKNAS